MRKIYIQPETEIVRSLVIENLLQNISKRTGQDVVTKETVDTPGKGGNNDDAGARRHFNLWDEWDEE